jgi:MFS family permease
MVISSSSSFFWGQGRLQFFILVCLSALDAADNALLGSSFPAFARDFGFNTAQLGVLSLGQNLSFALSLPIWGYLTQRMGAEHIPSLLAMGCFVWGIVLLLMVDFGGYYIFHLASSTH